MTTLSRRTTMKVTSVIQFELLVSQLEKNPSLAKGFQKGHFPINFKEEWDVISAKLNAIGPPIRESSGWQKVWKDLKFKVKKKMTYNKCEANATGGGIFKQMPLTPLEETVANLLQFGKLLSPQGVSCGAHEIELVEADETNVELITFEQTEPTYRSQMPEEIPSSSKKMPRQKTSKQEVMEFLKNQSDEQAKNSDETLKTLKAIENHLKDSAHYQRKLYHLSEERNNILKRQARREEENTRLHQEVKKKKLEILQKQLDEMQ